MKSIYTEFINSGLLFDKTTQSLSSLPYLYEDVKIKANTFVTSAEYNSSIDKLFYNTLFIYRACNVADFKVFSSYNFSLSSQENNNFKFYINEKQFYNTANLILSSAIDAELISTKFSNNKLFYLLCASRKNVSVLSLSDEGDCSLEFTTTKVGSISSDINFGNIVDIKTSSDNNLYIADDLYGNIYHYDITNLNLNENILNKRLVLKNVIGGEGDANNKTKFGKIKNLAVNDNYIVVQDYYNKCFKIFDKNLNWVNTCIFTKLFNKVEEFTSILLGDDNSLFCGKNKSLYKFKFLNNEFIFEKEYDISQYFRDDEYVQNLKLYQTDKKIIYIVTKKSIKKVWISVLDYIIGQYSFENDENVNIRWLTTTNSGKGNDILTLYSTKNEKDNYSFYYDDVFINSLFDNKDFNIYSKDEVYIKENEYVSSWVFVKNLKKIYLNLLTIVKNIKYRYKEENLYQSYPSIKEKIYNFNLLGFLNIENNSNFDIGINEILQSSVINRCISEILDLQQIIIIYLINNLNDTVYYSPEPEKLQPTVKKYFYFADESLILSPNPVKLDIFQALAPGAGIVVSIGGAPIEGIDGINITEGVNI